MTYAHSLVSEFMLVVMVCYCCHVFGTFTMWGSVEQGFHVLSELQESDKVNME
jgi:hypothetical protein